MPSAVIVVPAAIVMGEISVEGEVTILPAWGSEAMAAGTTALGESLGARGFRLVQPPTLAGAEAEAFEEWRLVAGEVLLNAAAYPDALMSPGDAAAWDHKVRRFDFETGDANFLADRSGAEAAAVFVGFCLRSDGDRLNARIAFEAGGFRPDMGSTRLVLGLIDLRTGEVLWMNRSAEEQDRFSARDLRDPKQMRAVFDKLLAAYPGADERQVALH